MDNTRIKNTLIVGSDTVTENDLAMVREILSTRYGGVTMLQGIGSWVEDADQFKGEYSGRLIDESAYIFLLSVPVSEFDPIFIKSAFNGLAGKAEWIHWEQTFVRAAHFQITAEPVQLPIAA